MKEKYSVPSKQLSKSKRSLFSFILVLLPFVFLIFLEFVLRLSGYGDNLSLFIKQPTDAFKEYKIVNPIIGKKYFQKFEYTAPAKDLFLKNKPDSVFRIFVMGSSSVAGFPYDNNLMFSRILNERLRDAYPTKKIEIVNTAITAINSFTLLDFIPQILNEKPDAILIYAGHNEFYGAFGAGSNEAVSHNPIMIRLHLKLMNFRFYQLTNNIIRRIFGLFRKENTALEKRGTLMTRIVKDADIIYGSKIYNEGIKNYEQNMGQILSMANQKNVPVFISDMVSNLRDIKPFKSIQTSNLKGADEYFNAAKKFEAQQEFKKAKEYYIIARDYDCVRFRASTDINKTIKNLAEKYRAHFVPSTDFFNSNSPNNIVGDNLLTEHVHPNVLGAFLLSESFYKELTRSNLLGKSVDLKTEKSLGSFTKDYGYSNLDYLIGYHRIANLKYHWPFCNESNGVVDYRKIYKPTGIVDSLAFTVMATKKISLNEAHQQLAKMYERNGDQINAFKEYNSLTEIEPFWSVNYRNAADCLLKLNDLPGALRFFERSTEYGDESFYAHFRAGEICMIKNDLETALSHFKKGMLNANESEKMKLLVKMYQVLMNLGRNEEAQVILNAYRKKNPNQTIQVSPRYNMLTSYIPIQVEEKVKNAVLFIKGNNQDKAIESLTESLEIKESSITWRMLGELLYNKKEYDKSNYFLLKAYPDFKFDTQFLNLFILANLTAQNLTEARNALEQLRQIDPNYPEIAKLARLVNNLHS